MKKVIYLTAIAVLAFLILLPAVQVVNRGTFNFSQELVADGSPRPPLPPPPGVLFVADGSPRPPLPPPPTSSRGSGIIA
jgi:hypothetical protein